MSAYEKQVGGEHYNVRRIQHWDYVIANQMPYLDAQAFKYIDRHARKNGKQDLQKAIHFIEKMIETYYPEPPKEEFVPVAWDKDTPPTMCPNHSLGEHQWSHIYKHGVDGRLKDHEVCDLCGIARERV
jgi:hypothetical protein